eukprot:c15083_g1_i1.p2 GENE.c15083_g1_i1~~c15083_g1_i1.p2  ORF type:complete len:206 (-),score=-51.06 c15083_g1_i1:39-656(-)
MSVSASNHTHTTDVIATGNHGNIASFELDELCDLASLEVNLDGVVDLDVGVGVADGATVMGHNVWHTTETELLSLDTAELELGLEAFTNAVEGEAALGVEQQTEVLLCLFHANNVHEASRVVGVSADLAVNLDESLHADSLDFLASQGVLETVSEEDGQGKALAELVGTGGGAGGPVACQLVEHPVLGGINTLQMLLGSTSHFLV